MKFFTGIVLLLLLSCSSHDGDKSNAATIVQRSSSLTQKDTPNPYVTIDISPMDMIYYPVDFPKLKMSKAVEGSPVMRIIYSRPHRQGRTIFGELLKYGEPWRLGANEATEIELFKEVTIQNKKIPKGRYVLYCIPKPDSWTIVFNSNIYSWGLKPDPKKDLYKFLIPVRHSAIPIEYFTMAFEDSQTGANLIMTWDEVIARLPLNFK